MRMKRPRFAAFAASTFILLAVVAAPPGAQSRAAAPACDAGNGGITLPQGFCAVVVAHGLGAARHMATAPNGDLFVALNGDGGRAGGIVALRDTNGDGKADAREQFGSAGGTGIALRNGFLYHASTTAWSATGWRQAR